MATYFSILLPEMPELEKSFADAPEIVKSNMADAIKKATTTVQSLVKSNSPVKTGALRASVVQSVNGLTGTVSTNKKYARYVEEGTGLYGYKKALIYPTAKQVLATKINPGFGTKNAGGYFIIGKYSRGQKPNPFFQRGYDLGKIQVQEIFEAANQAIVKEIGA